MLRIGPVSTVFNFTTIIAAPVAPVLTAPANNATNVAINPTLTWVLLLQLPHTEFRLQQIHYSLALLLLSMIQQSLQQ